MLNNQVKWWRPSHRCYAHSLNWFANKTRVIIFHQLSILSTLYMLEHFHSEMKQKSYLWYSILIMLMFMHMNRYSFLFFFFCRPKPWVYIHVYYFIDDQKLNWKFNTGWPISSWAICVEHVEAFEYRIETSRLVRKMFIQSKSLIAVHTSVPWLFDLESEM